MRERFSLAVYISHLEKSNSNFVSFWRGLQFKSRFKIEILGFYGNSSNKGGGVEKWCPRHPRRRKGDAAIVKKCLFCNRHNFAFPSAFWTSLNQTQGTMPCFASFCFVGGLKSTIFSRIEAEVLIPLPYSTQNYLNKELKFTLMHTSK